jgi:hypothetical protein
MVMSDVVLSPITSGYNLTKVNDNFDKVEQKINEEIVHLVGGNNVMLQALDMNSNAILNIGVDLSNPDSMLTLEVADLRYYNVAGDTLTGPMDVNFQRVYNLGAPLTATEAVRRLDLDAESVARAAGDASLQDQLNGTNPPMGSAFSTVSWHDQIITNSINIPANKNAWSFGPTLTIAVGQVVTIGSGSFWTIANGATTGSGVLTVEIPNPLDMGTL